MTGKNFLYFAEPYNGDLYILTNEDAPRYRVFKTSSYHAHARALARDHSAVRRRAHLAADHRRAIVRPLRAECALAAEALHHRRQTAGRNRVAHARHDHRYRRRVRQHQRVLPLLVVHRADDHLPLRHSGGQEHAVGLGADQPSTPASTRPSRSGTRRRTARACRCFWSCARG